MISGNLLVINQNVKGRSCITSAHGGMFQNGYAGDGMWRSLVKCWGYTEYYKVKERHTELCRVMQSHTETYNTKSYKVIYNHTV